MPLSLADHPLFEPWVDPVSGVTSYLLRERVAPLQQTFYFTTPSLTHDARYLWFYTAFPPSGSAQTGRTLAVADLQLGTVTGFPETQFRDASPFVDLETGSAYWCSHYAVYKRGPQPEAPVEKVNELPAQLHRQRQGHRLATHMTRSPFFTRAGTTAPPVRVRRSS